MPSHTLYPSSLLVAEFETPNHLTEIATENLLRARLIVESGLPATLAEGLFARPGNHEVNICLGSAPDKKTPDMTLTYAGGNILRLAAPPQCDHPMDAEYFSEIPVRHGLRFANFSAIPSSPGMLALKKHPFSPDAPNALHEATIAFFQYNPAEFDLKIQVEDDMQYRTIAHLIIPAQIATDRPTDADVERLSVAPPSTRSRRSSASRGLATYTQ